MPVANAVNVVDGAPSLGDNGSSLKDAPGLLGSINSWPGRVCGGQSVNKCWRRALARKVRRR